MNNVKEGAHVIVISKYLSKWEVVGTSILAGTICNICYIARGWDAAEHDKDGRI